jgi:hypothetical protein
MDPAWGCPAKIALPGSVSGGRSVTLGTEDRELRARLGLRKRHDHLRLRPRSGYEQAEAELCRVEVDEVAVTLGPLA